MANSPAVIIGAMIVAPLMNPIITMSFGIAYGDWRLVAGPGAILIAGIALVILISFTLSSIVATRIIGSEIFGRAHPNLLDLGVAIGAGAAGAFARSRHSVGNALPGVAIAVALVPPLCVVGYGLSLGSHAVADPAHSLVDDVLNVERGATLLFLVNLCAIILVSTIVFVSQGYGRWKSAKLGLITTSVLTLAVAFPLVLSFSDIVQRDRVLEAISETALENPHWEQARVDNITIQTKLNPALIQLDVIAPVGLIDTSDAAALKSGVKKHYGMPVDVEINLLEYQVLKAITKPVPEN